MRAAIARIDAGPSRGTGFLAGDGLALTAFHVIADRKRALTSGDVALYGEILLTFPCGEAKATVVDGCCDPAADFALLTIEWVDGAAPPQPLPLALAETLSFGTAWRTFGFPDANPEGMVNAGEFRDSAAIHQGQAAFQLFSKDAAAGNGEPVSGFSGAPVVIEAAANQFAAVGLLRSSLMDKDRNAVAGALYACPVASVLAKAKDRLPVPDPCFGLPGLPRRALPEKPFKQMVWFTADEAEIFFGRNREIAETYRRLHSNDEPPVLLLYGQAGVGKSSFLDAGLLPRLKWHHEVLYMRRDRDRTLLATLRDALDAKDADSLADAWRAREQGSAKPLIVFFDQIEEIYTHANSGAADELAELTQELKALFDEETRVRGRLVLSFRKEWFPEIQKQMEASKLPYSKLFLQALDRESVIEAVTGVTRTERLRNQYGLQIDPGLPEAIANTLLEDHESPIAPTLQILLTRMWETRLRDRATGKPRSTPRLTLDDFMALKAEGFGLGDFLDRGLDAIESDHAEWTDSGFALDVLWYHVTKPSLTARECSKSELQATYSNRAADMPPLVAALKDKSLLVDTAQDDGRRATRLCHDTLAPLVQQRYAGSDRPGQRAHRILENHVSEWTGRGETGLLDAGSLATVEEGAAGMRAFNDKELKLIQASRRMRWVRRISAWAALLLVALFAGYGVWQQIKAVREGRIAEARLAVSESVRRTQSEPGTALMLAVAAIGRSRSLGDPQLWDDAQENLTAAIQQAREEAYIQAPSSSWQATAFSRSGVIATGGSRIRLWDSSGAPLPAKFQLPPATSVYRTLVFSPGGNTLASCTNLGVIELWDLQGNALTRPFSAGGVGACSLAFARSGDELVSFTRADILTLWDLDGNKIWSVQATHRVSLFYQPHRLAIGRTPQGQELIVVLLGSGSIGIWNMDGKPVGKPFETGHFVDSISLSQRDGQLVILGGGTSLGENLTESSGILNFWNLDGSQSSKPILFAGDNVLDAQYSPGGKMIVVLFWGTLKFIDASGADVLPPFHTDASTTSKADFAIDPGGTRIAAWSDPGRLHILDLSNAFDAVNGLLDGASGDPPMTAQFSPNGDLLATGTAQGNVELWSVEDGNVSLLRTLAPPGSDNTPDAYKLIEALAFDADGNRIAAVDGSNAILVWSAGGQPLAYLPPLPRDNPASVPSSFQIHFSSDGQSVMYGTPTGVFVRNLANGKGQSILDEVLSHACAVALSPDGAAVATAMQQDNTVRIWDLQGKQKGPALKLDNLPSSIAYSADGKRLIVEPASAGLSIWKLEDGAIASLMPLNRQTIQDSKFIGSNLATSPDDMQIFTGGQGVAAWFSRSGDRFAILSASPDQDAPWNAYALAVSADGRFLAGTQQGGVHVWRANWQEWLKVACTRLRHHPILSDTHDPDPFVRESVGIANNTCQNQIWSK